MKSNFEKVTITKIALLWLLIFYVSCTRESKENLRTSVSESNSSGEETIDENDSTESAFSGEASQDFFAALSGEWSSQSLSLTPIVKTIPVDALVFSIASKLNLNDSSEWRPPVLCPVALDQARLNCKNSATKAYCESTSMALETFYCKLGGDDRAIISSVLREWTTGDLVLLFEMAQTVCSNSDIATRMGLFNNVSRTQFFTTLIPKFMNTVTGSRDYLEEKEFIETQFLRPLFPIDGNTSEDLSIISTNSTLFQKAFTQTCTYLLMHPRQLSY